MSRGELEAQSYELIKAHILNPESQALPYYLREPLERIMSASKLLDKNPVTKNVVAILMAKYPNISRSQAYEDCKRAQRLFNSKDAFEYPWWQNWLIQDIAEMISKAKEIGDLKALAMGHQNLIKAIGQPKDVEIDPKLIEKHQIVFTIQVDNKIVNIDSHQFNKLPANVRELLVSNLNQEISDDEAIEIFKS